MIAAAAGAEEVLPLGTLVLASALAGLLSAYVWGRFSDRSSRTVLILSGLSGGAGLVLCAGLAMAGGLHLLYALPVTIFVVMIAYHGVRLGRSTHLTDMATVETRAAYTALSNTVVGVVLLAGGLFSVLAAVTGPAVVLLVMAGMAGLASVLALGLDEVQA